MDEGDGRSVDPHCGPVSPLEQIDRLKSGLIVRATGGEFPGGDDAYLQLRRSLRTHPAIFSRLPDFVRSCADIGEFWLFIRDHFPSYHQRRAFIRQSFGEVTDYLEANEPDLSMLAVTETLSELNSRSVQDVWLKALQRRRHDPDGAITAARTMLETVCKHILDDESIPYGRHDDLPKLWRTTATQLKLTPEQHEATDIKSLLGNCQAVVNGLANLRNAVGDAHGQGRKPMQARPRHAELAVNLAGSMASFVVATWREQTARRSYDE